MSAALIGLVVVCASSSAAAALFLSGGEEKSPQPAAQPAAQPTEEPAEEPTEEPAQAPPPDTVVKGYSRNTTFIKNVENVPSPEGCIAEAKKVGSPYWIHRNSTHPTMPNSCDIKAWSDIFSGDDSDSVHVSGCTYGGDPQTGCTPWPSVQGFPGGATNVTPNAEFSTKDPNDCVKKAQEIGALSWGYRTANHGGGPNTCFFYSDFNSGFTGNPDDKAHISGCTNKKSLFNKCA